MEDIAALEGRIARALDRIRVGADALAARANAPPPEPDEAALTALRDQLEAEQGVTAALEARVQTLSEEAEAARAALEAQLAGQRHHLAELDSEMQRLRQSAEALAETSAQLRAAVTPHSVDPHHINAAMLAELDALRALRSTDRAEIEALLSELRPLAREAS